MPWDQLDCISSYMELDSWIFRILLSSKFC
jgi:hypothetical protein